MQSATADVLRFVFILCKDARRDVDKTATGPIDTGKVRTKLMA